MENSCIYQLFNNASIAAFVGIVGTLLVAIFVGRRVYREQRKFDRKLNIQDELAKKAALLYQNCEFVTLSINRIVHTWKRFNDSWTPEEKEKFIKGSLKYEVDKFGVILMEKISEIRSAMRIYSELYFNENKEVKDIINEIFNNLKIWHDSVVKYVECGGLIEQYITEIESTSLGNIDSSVKKLLRVLEK